MISANDVHLADGAHASVTLGGSNLRSDRSTPPATRRRRGPRRRRVAGSRYRARARPCLGSLESPCSRASNGGGGRAGGGRNRRRRARLRPPGFGRARERCCCSQARELRRWRGATGPYGLVGLAGVTKWSPELHRRRARRRRRFGHGGEEATVRERGGGEGETVA